MLNYFSSFFTNKAIALYFVALIIVFFLFFSSPMEWYFYLFGIIEVCGFFYFSSLLTKQWAFLPEKTYIRRLFTIAFLLRFIWIIFSYFFFQYILGNPFEFHSADAIGYHGEAVWIHQMISGEGLEPYWTYIGGRYSDLGYPFYLGIQYTVTNNSIIIARLLKVLYGAFTCVLVYKLAKRNFGEEAGRIAGILVMLFPNLIFYCGLHLKETEMILLTVWYIERADYLLRSKQYSFWNILSVLLLAGVLFFFRTVLGTAGLIAFITAIVFSSSHLLGWKKKLLIGVWVIVTLFFLVGGKIANEVAAHWQMRNVNQSTSMEWRAERKGGNKFSKYMNGAVFAPMIIAIPFPTTVDIGNQKNQQLIHGGNFDKNVMVFFVLIAAYWIIKKKKWRDYTLIESFTIGYLIILAFSAFAQSERFHLPILPFLLIFAAFGITKMNNTNKQYYIPYLVFIGIAFIAWNWFKLAGRGLT